MEPPTDLEELLKCYPVLFKKISSINWSLVSSQERLVFNRDCGQWLFINVPQSYRWLCSTHDYSKSYLTLVRSQVLGTPQIQDGVICIGLKVCQHNSFTLHEIINSYMLRRFLLLFIILPIFSILHNSYVSLVRLSNTLFPS